LTAENPSPESPAVAAIRARWPGAVRDVAVNSGQFRVTVPREKLIEILTALRDDPVLAFDFLVDLTAIDLSPAEPRFRTVYVLRSMTRREELVLKCEVPEDDCRVPSAHEVFRCVNAMERECYDMFGIHFTGHPDLRRILMPEMFTDFPLRKDFPMVGKMSDQEWAEWIVARAQRTEGDPA
jgi:NADH-quinone oxidoreductase subunit C